VRFAALPSFVVVVVVVVVIVVAVNQQTWSFAWEPPSLYKP
jgi:hypothetical protein